LSGRKDPFAAHLAVERLAAEAAVEYHDGPAHVFAALQDAGAQALVGEAFVGPACSAQREVEVALASSLQQPVPRVVDQERVGRLGRRVFDRAEDLTWIRGLFHPHAVFGP
jgi:hypothetical protein